MHTKVGSFALHYIVYLSPQSFFKFIDAIIVNHQLSQYLSVQSPHTIVAILFYDIIKSSKNVIADIVHCSLSDPFTISTYTIGVMIFLPFLDGFVTSSILRL